MSNKEEQREDFEHWLAYMDDFLEQFFAAIPESLAAKLDYSPTSLAVLEAHILANYETIEQIQEEDQSQMLNGFSIYIGETFRKGLGGGWDIELDNEIDANYGVPAVTNYGKYESKIAPIFRVTASISRRTGSFLTSLYEANDPLSA